ncbi:MAG: ABC transporter permease subunit [Isosphaeraceae bacterium]
MTGTTTLVLIVAILVPVLLWPAVATIGVALRGGSEPGAGLLSPAPIGLDSGEIRRPLALFAESTRLVLATEAIVLPLGVLVGFLVFRTDAVLGRLCLLVIALAAFVPLPLHATAWLGAFGNVGRAQALGLGMIPILVGWPGAAFVHAMAAFPWVVLMTGVGLLGVEPELEDAARLELPASRVVLQVTLRRALAAIAGAALAVALLTAGDMTVTDLLQVRTYAEEAYLQYNLGRGPLAAASVTLPPLLVLGGLVAIGARLILSREPPRGLSAATRPRTWKLGAWRWPVGLGLTGFVALLVGLPLVSLVWRAGRVGGNAALGRPPAWSFTGLRATLQFAWDDSSEALGQSLLWSAVAACVAVILAWCLAWASRNSAFWRVVTAGAVALALATPGPVVGFALVYAYRDIPRVYDSTLMIVVALVARMFPYALLVVWPAVRGVPVELIEAARIDGHGPSGVIWRVMIPLTRAALLAAWCVAFTLALGELPATNLVTPPGTTPSRS